MYYANDEIFKIRYNTGLDRLQVDKEKWTRRLAKKIIKNKLLTMIIFAFIIFSTINVIMIYNFIKILQNI